MITEQKEYQGIKKLDLSWLPRVKIIAKDGTQTTVALNGSQEAVSGISFNVKEDGTLVIEGPQYGSSISIAGGASGNGYNIVNHGNGAVAVGAGAIAIAPGAVFMGEGGVAATDTDNSLSNPSESDLVIVIEIPNRVNLAMTRVLFSEVSAVIENLKIQADGNDQHNIGSVSGVALITSGGNSSVKAGSINSPGDTSNTIDVSGQGYVKIVEGNIGKLKITASGASITKIGATIGDAKFIASGASSIKAETVTGSLNKATSSAAATIRVTSEPDF